MSGSSRNLPCGQSARGPLIKEQLMATNPFEDEDGRYFALINEEGQYSLWPVPIEVPDGWTVVFGEETRKACLDYIEENWTDMRPKSLIEEMARYEAQQGNALSG
jgi:MbtH protein